MVIIHDPVMTLTYFRTRSTWVAYAFEWGKLLKCHLKKKTCRKLANGQNIDYPEKIWPQVSIIFIHVFLVHIASQVSVYRTIGPLVIENIAKLAYLA